MLEPLYLNSSDAGGVLENGYTVNARETLVRDPDFGVPGTLIVEIHDPDGKFVRNLARIPSRIYGQVSESPEALWLYKLFDARAAVDALGSTIVLAHGSNPEVQVLDHEFNLRIIIRWSEPNREVTRADIRAWREDYRERIDPSDWG